MTPKMIGPDCLFISPARRFLRASYNAARFSERGCYLQEEAGS